MPFPTYDLPTTPSGAILETAKIEKNDQAVKPAHANILVVDDDAETLELLREILGDEGYRVVTSSSGEEALEVGKQELFERHHKRHEAGGKSERT